MAARFRSFVILAGMRTGSNFLEANLNALPGVQSRGELFNPHFIGKKDQTELSGFDLAARATDPLALLARMEGEGGLTGFRFFHDHDPRVLDAVLDDPACAKIVLTRNPAESYVSWKAAQATGQWKLTHAKNLKQAMVRFDEAEFAAQLAAMQSFHRLVQHRLQTTGQAAFHIDYENLTDPEVLNGLAIWLGIEGRLESVDPTLKKQNPEPLLSRIANPEAAEAALARLDLFDLARLPGFEPRRQAMVPAYIAARGAGLVFMPVPGGPEEAITDWLSRIGSGGLEGGFSQKTLKDWKRAHPRHRSFTVLRHPVVRGWAVWHSRILSGELAELRQAMVKTFKLPVPEAGAGPAELREGYLAFLRFVKMNLAGQTGLRVPPDWASQIVLIQGFAQVQPPDAVLREEGLEEGLAWLSREAGVSMVPVKAEGSQMDALEDIYDPDIEKAAREAWPRDYQGFGFGNWD